MGHMGGNQSSTHAVQIEGDRPSDYAGDVAVEEAWRVIQEDSDAILVDVRTNAEWSFVGVPDMSAAGKQLHCIEWQSFPTMNVNEGFAAMTAKAVKEAGGSETTNLFFLCRSGVRSRAAAIALTQAGFKAAHNVAGGFEGDLDGESHRGRSNGWKAAGLPWRQN